MSGQINMVILGILGVQLKDSIGFDIRMVE